MSNRKPANRRHGRAQQAARIRPPSTGQSVVTASARPGITPSGFSTNAVGYSARAQTNAITSGR